VGEGTGVRYAVLGGVLLAGWEEQGSPVLTALDSSLDTQWTWRAAGGEEQAPELRLHQVISVDPLIVEISDGGTYQLWRVDPHDGSHQVLIDTYSELILPCTDGDMTSCAGTAWDGSLLYLATHGDRVRSSDQDFEDGHGSVSHQNVLVAIDGTSGAELWRTEWLAGRRLTPMDSDDGRLLAYQHATTSGVPGMVLEIDPETGTLAPVLALGHDSHGELARLAVAESPEPLPRAMWRQGHLVLLGDRETLLFRPR
jgi:outer membrane protein assembly factor BamB